MAFRGARDDRFRCEPMRVLVGVDFSDPSRAAAREVASRPWPPETELRLVTYVPPLDALASQVFISDVMNTEAETARSLIEELKASLPPTACTVSTAVMPGHPRAALPEYARGWGADFIYVGSRGRNRLQRLLLGSVASAVVRHAPCSAGVIRPRPGRLAPEGGFRILLATDGSSSSHEAVRSVAARPWPAGTEARAVAVADRFAPLSSLDLAPSQELRELDELNRAQATAAAGAAARALSGAGISARSDVLAGEPKTCLLAECESWKPDLVVVGSHGRRGAERLLFGSVSEAIVVHAPCSVEVIREVRSASK